VATDEAIEQRLGEDPKDEDVKERLEREHGELLEELRALIPGAQVLFGFLLAIRFTSPFSELNTVQRDVYYATLLTTAVALVFLLAPSAYHRLRFREGDKDAMIRKGNREAIAGTGAIALAFTGVLYLITDLVFTTQAAIGVAVGLFRVDRVALVGDCAVSQGPRAGSGQADLGCYLGQDRATGPAVYLPLRSGGSGSQGPVPGDR
jgi:hypothetical protein